MPHAFSVLYPCSVADVPLPSHVVIPRRDGRRQVLLHRSVAVIGNGKVEIRSARGTVVLPLFGLGLAAGSGYLMATTGGALPLWALVAMLLGMLFLVPLSVMSLVNSVVGADVIIDAAKNSATWQQGYLGMGVGTKELVPFEKVDHLEITVEGAEAVRWQELPDDLRQFTLTLVKTNGRRLTLAHTPVPARGQIDGMDRTLAVAQAIAALAGTTIHIPEGWDLVEVDAETGDPVAPPRPSRSPRRRAKSVEQDNRGRSC